MGKPLSGLELLLSVVSSLLILTCAGLAAVCWFSLKPEVSGGPVLFSGRLLISHGAVFSDPLTNSSSPLFKSLAFDVQQLVSEAFSLSELRQLYRSCSVRSFSRGSVAVTFDLWFDQLIEPTEAEQQLWAGLQAANGRGLVIDKNSIKITDKVTESTSAPPITPTSGPCPPHQVSCDDRSMCVPTDRLCDGVHDCPDASDEAAASCATSCDGQFELRGVSGSFSSTKSEMFNSSSFCRWIIRVDRGLSVKVHVQYFGTEENMDAVKLYEGVGPNKLLIAEFSGSTPSGTVWLPTDQSTVEFSSDGLSQSGFKASYHSVNTSILSDQDKLSCSFQQGLCFWRQQPDDDDDWIRTSGSTFPPLTGPSADHTLGNSSGFYIVTPMSPGQWLKSFRIQSLPLTPLSGPVCLSFWYHMFGEDVHRLRVLLRPPPPGHSAVLLQRDGNYGDTWNLGQVTLNLTCEATVVFEALKEGGMRNDVALDDIALTDTCGPAPPEPTNVPPPTTTPPIPEDCGGPFELWEPNSTFNSPNYPESYGNKASCLWTLHAIEGHNIQLHFLDFDVEETFDVVEVRDGAGPNSTLLAVLTGSDEPATDLFSTTNQMTVWFYTDSSGHGRGFRANFSSGVSLGSPAPCAGGQFQCQTGSCVPASCQCDGAVHCPDGSDEADCVVLQVNSSSRLRFRLAASLLVVCADTWSSHLSDFTCQYLGYRSGEASLLPALPQDSPFANVSITSNGTVETSIRY